MKHKKIKIGLLALICTLLVKIIIMLVALPKPTVDYVAIYNEVTKPVDFTPENNAGYDYLKVEKLYIEPSEELQHSGILARWHEDGILFSSQIDPNELMLIEKWVKSNQPAIDQIKVALEKPYCWFERKSNNGSVLGITSPETYIIRKMSEVLVCRAKLNALQGNLSLAVEDIINCYHIGQHQCRENLSLVEQFLGIRIKEDAIKTALQILHGSKMTPEELKYFQDSFQFIQKDDADHLGLLTEKITFYDIIQMSYLDWIRGINRPAFRLLYGTRCMCGDNIFFWIDAFTAPPRQEAVRQTDRLFELYEHLGDKTQWQIYHQFINETKEIEAIRENLFFTKLYSGSYVRQFALFQESNALRDALITILSILRFKADNHRLPETLEALVTLGYLKELPQDPYSEGILKYKVTEDDFRLYSLGKDFEDNNGEPVIIEGEWIGGLGGPSIPGMPVSKSSSSEKIKHTIYKDNVYWPEVKNATFMPVEF